MACCSPVRTFSVLPVLVAGWVGVSWLGLWGARMGGFGVWVLCCLAVVWFVVSGIVW